MSVLTFPLTGAQVLASIGRLPVAAVSYNDRNFQVYRSADTGEAVLVPPVGPTGSDLYYLRDEARAPFFAATVMERRIGQKSGSFQTQGRVFLDVPGSDKCVKLKFTNGGRLVQACYSKFDEDNRTFGSQSNFVSRLWRVDGETDEEQAFLADLAGARIFGYLDSYRPHQVEELESDAILLIGKAKRRNSPVPLVAVELDAQGNRFPVEISLVSRGLREAYRTRYGAAPLLAEPLSPESLPAVAAIFHGGNILKVSPAAITSYRHLLRELGVDFDAVHPV